MIYQGVSVVALAKFYGGLGMDVKVVASTFGLEDDTKKNRKKCQRRHCGYDNPKRACSKR
jgi:hypothetical protein